MMRFMERLHEGMMTITGKWSDGEIGVFRFAVGYYSRFILVLTLGFTLGAVMSIIEPRRDKLAQGNNDERTKHGNSHQKEVGACKAVHAY